MQNKRVAIVTGGTRGMGQAISIELAKRGNIVCAIYRSHEESAKYTLEEMKKYEQECQIFQADVSKEEEVIYRTIRPSFAFYMHL